MSQVRRQAIGSFGLLASANVWFFVGLAVLLFGGLFELSRPGPRTWLLCTYLAALIVAIHATVPILYGVPEYEWVYKHIGIAQALGRYGRVTDPIEHLPAVAGAVRSRRLGQRACPHRAAVLRRVGTAVFRACRCTASVGRLPTARSKPPRRFSRFVPI